jgi:hypothetical protein
MKTRRNGIIDIDHKQYPELHTYITKKYPPTQEEEGRNSARHPDPRGWHRANKIANMKIQNGVIEGSS